VASKGRNRERYAQISDAIAIGHFVVANLVVLLGAVTPLFLWMRDEYPGLKFVYMYIDRPLFEYFKSMDALSADPFYTYVVGEMIILGSSFLYWVIAYFVLKAFFAFYE